MRLAVFASGGGSNFEAIAQAIQDGTLPAQLALCLSNKATAGVFARAQKFQTPTALLNPTDFADEATYEAALLALLHEHAVDFIALAGYMRKIPGGVVSVFRHRMLNIHPALLPAFGGPGMYGQHVHAAVLAKGARWTGATVHVVDEEYDTGPIVLQVPVPVAATDTAASLAARVLRVEHRLYPEALRLFAENRVTVTGPHVRIEGPTHRIRPDFSDFPTLHERS